MCLIHIFCLFDLFVFTKAISYDSPYIVYWYSVYKIHCCWRTSSSHHHHEKNMSVDITPHIAEY